MKITEIIESCSPEVARSSLYYAARYIKQAANFEKYEKDIFDDEAHNLPTQQVRNTTLKIVAAIEDLEGSKAAYFNDQTIIRVLDEITDAEAALVPEFSEDEKNRLERLAAEMYPPR